MSGLRAAAPGADPPGAGRLPGVPDPLPPGRGGPARVLAGLAGEKKRRAKRLSAACYSHLRGALLAGGGEVPAGDFVLRGTLRRRFAQEQATMAAYLTGTETTTDPCLQQLFWEHAREAWDQACKIRTLVEQA
ncbi:MAG: hypothetical protein ACLT9P_03395 [Evtepia gabavorous]